MMKFDYIWYHLSTAFISKKNSSMLCHKEWLAPSTTVPTKMARGLNEYKQMAEIYFRFFFKKSLIQNYRLKLFNGMYIHLLISKLFLQLLRLLTDGTRYCLWVFSLITFYCRQEHCDQSTPFSKDNYFIL